MATIVTGANGTLAYHSTVSATDARDRAFRLGACFTKQVQCGFARFPGFADNANHAPSGHEGAVTCDLALDFLYRVANRG